MDEFILNLKKENNSIEQQLETETEVDRKEKLCTSKISYSTNTRLDDCLFIVYSFNHM